MNSSTVRIVRAGPARIADLQPLYLGLHEHQVAIAPELAGAPARSGAEAWRQRRAKYDVWLTVPGAFVLVAERCGVPIGYAAVSPGEGFQGWESEDRIADLHDLAVLPPERGQGIGTMLMDALERELAAAGFKHLRLRVIAANVSALRFYERRGMAPISQVLAGPLPPKSG
jgi:ribosomal protein S18 acetylase RimI-like enzyme